MRAGLLLALVLLAAPPLAGRAPGASEVWHATRPLQPGDVLRPDDVAPQAPRRAAAGQIEADRDVIGLEVKRRLRAGVAITERDIGERSAVRAAQPIRVFWKRHGISLELEGRALEAGAIGEQIRVHNPQSGRTIRALVVAEGTAEVRGAP